MAIKHWLQSNIDCSQILIAIKYWLQSNIDCNQILTPIKYWLQSKTKSGPAAINPTITNSPVCVPTSVKMCCFMSFSFSRPDQTSQSSEWHCSAPNVICKYIPQVSHSQGRESLSGREAKFSGSKLSASSEMQSDHFEQPWTIHINDVDYHNDNVTGYFWRLCPGGEGAEGHLPRYPGRPWQAPHPLQVKPRPLHSG